MKEEELVTSTRAVAVGDLTQSFGALLAHRLRVHTVELQPRWANISRLQPDLTSTEQQADTDGSRTSSIGVHQLLFCAVARLLMVVFLCTAVTGLC